ncbi:MAG: transglutaminase domain-containing protein [Bacteroidetes bacterium]|nr:transglutaminase domain-containing protein [Bacteroidota bacterium]
MRPPKWKYVEDPRKNEYYSSASNTLTKTGLTGDCDDFAILMYSLITAIGGEARISFAWKKIPDSDTYFGHAFTEVDIVTIPPETLVNTMIARFGEFNIDKINYDHDDKGVWLNLDWWAAYPGWKIHGL